MVPYHTSQKDDSLPFSLPRLVLSCHSQIANVLIGCPAARDFNSPGYLGECAKKSEHHATKRPKGKQGLRIQYTVASSKLWWYCDTT